MRKYGWLAVVAGLFVWSGCAELIDDDDGPDDGEEVQESDMELTVDIKGGTDVAGFKFTISECGGAVVKQEVKSLEDMVMPGMIPEFENAPFDETSEHLFADYYTMLPAGCYDIIVQPISKKMNKADYEYSKDCSAASAKNVEVKKDKTTEILLVSQCKGPERGGLDVIAALNHAPVLKELKFQKFNQECDKVKICATAYDPDGDPIEFEWKQLKGPKLSTPIHVKDTKRAICDGTCTIDEYEDYIKAGHKKVTQCADLKLGKTGDYKFKLSVFDLYWDDGQLVRFEDSKASLTFPVYALDNPEVECKPDKKGYSSGD